MESLRANRKLSPDNPGCYTMEHTITAGDTSAMGPAYYARFTDWQGVCREQAGILLAPKFSSGISGGDYSMVTQSCSCTFLRPASFGDRIVVRLTVPWVRMSFMKGEYTFHRRAEGEERLIAVGEQVWASMRHLDDGYDLCPWPRELVDCAAALGADTSRAHVE